MVRSIVRLCVAALLLSAMSFSQENRTFIFLSDTQTPIWAEKLFLRSYDNERATQKIFASILAEETLDAVIHAGDITGHGWLRGSWKPILPFIDSLRERSVPFIAAKGNHDYYFIPPWGMNRFGEYIPNGTTDYSRHTFGDLCILVLNSNIDRLTIEEQQQQRRWYIAALRGAESDFTVRTVMTVAHHSPYTNSAMVSGSDVMRDDYLPLFISSQKSRLWIGGHAHRFEHFRKNGKDLVVIGGGGGLFHHKKTEEVEDDLHSEDGRFFHYLRCSVTVDSLVLDVVRIFPDSTAQRSVYRHSIARE
jgi:3',5'-cyclic AMP phosphodiesterase CpdA